MTTAPIPSKAEELAQWLEQDWDGMGIPELLDVATELRRLHAQVQELQEERSARMRQSERLSARISEVTAERDRFRAALNEWIKKTEWVQKSLQPRELGKHRADILRERITALEAHKAANGDPA